MIYLWGEYKTGVQLVYFMKRPQNRGIINYTMTRKQNAEAITLVMNRTQNRKEISLFYEEETEQESN